MHIDGSGLAFHLYKTAYARHVADVLGQTNNNNNNGERRRGMSSCPCSVKKLSPEHVTKLLPNLLPLGRLDEVTREFVETLQQKHMMQLKIYFDGELRREAKQATDEERRRKRPSEWSALQQYCCNGVMPSIERVCQWDREFPRNKLFIEQIKYTLQQMQVPIEVCQEEADAEIVKAALQDGPNSYVVGNDTDFCFFQSAKYIPLNTLHASDSVVNAVIMSRNKLAVSLNLPDTDAMVELALLMRNDYVKSDDKLDFNDLDTDSILDHLRASGEDYRVTSSSEDTQKAIRFVRTLYNLGNLDEEFPLISKGTKQDTDGEEIVGPIMKVPDDFPDQLAALLPGDTSLKGAILRCLQVYVDQTNGESNRSNMIRQEHLEAFKQMASYKEDASSKENWKPRWEDVPAAYLIASCILYVRRKSSPKNPLVRLSPPEKLFDEYKFHALMHTIRKPRSPKGLKNGKNNAPGSPHKRKSKVEPRLNLPVDEHEEKILDSIKRNRVTIIQGETGCGKSSRVPVMIMNAPPPDPALTDVKLFISQPRRIAAKALVERLRATEPDIGRKVALRMGHGTREYENSGTKAWFVTTGYLVRLLAKKPENFEKVSHVVIDEVHERSVDTDILCLLCRRLLQSNRHIRLILMSATLAAKLYQDYFDIAEPPLKVGARRFPVETIFVEDISSRLQLTPKEVKAVMQIESECRKTMCIATPTNSTMECVYSVAAKIAIMVGKPGSSVLIFVPGMADIVSISEKIESLYVPGVVFRILPIHSDLPFEDQMVVFDKMEEEVKIIIATNAAESSLTLPDCDHVIDTGLEKKITYNAKSHRQILLPCWISRASAQQRSGRVGRVRPGQVYRLYSREAYETMMSEFESGEMLRMPLDSVILLLKDILTNEDTTSSLMSSIEPPDLSTIGRSYLSLRRSGFISKPDESGEITTLGCFVISLGIDLTLGAMLGLGIQFGVGPEAIELAAVLSFPKTPWLLSNPLVYKPNQFNSGTMKTYVSKNRFDAKLFSEPFEILNLIWDFSQLHGSKMSSFCVHHGVHLTRIKRLVSTRNNIVNRVSEFFKMDPSLLQADLPPAKMCHAKVNILRTIQCWVFSDSIIEHKKVSLKPNPDGSVTIALKSKTEVKEEHLDKLLRADRHQYKLDTRINWLQSGGYKVDEEEPFDLTKFLPCFEERFISFIIEMDFDMGWFWYEQEMKIFLNTEKHTSPEYSRLRDLGEETVLTVVEKRGRGRAERASGKWTCVDASTVSDPVTRIRKITITESSMVASADSLIHSCLRRMSIRAVSFDFSKNGKTKKKRSRVNPSCQIFFTGQEQWKLSHTDYCDLMAIANLKENYWLHDKKESIHQTVTFRGTQHGDLEGPRNTESSLYESDESSWKRPLLQNIPEGACLLAVLASSRRRESSIQLTMPQSEDDAKESEDGDVVSFGLDDGLSKISARWTPVNKESSVFVVENSVPASAVPIGCPGTLYSCCANTLDLRGGSVKVEGLTLLPPGSYFILLAFLAFGLTPDGLGNFPRDNEDDLDVFIQDCLQWVENKDKRDEHQYMEMTHSIDWPVRIRKTIEFARSCSNLGEQLVCFPDKVRALCEIFDGVDDYSMETWRSLDSDPFTAENIRKRRELAKLTAGMARPGRGYREQESSVIETSPPIAPKRAPADNTSGIGRAKHEDLPSEKSTVRIAHVKEQASLNTPLASVKLQTLAAMDLPGSLPFECREDGVQEEKKSKDFEVILRGTVVEKFPDELETKSQRLFAPELRSGEHLKANEMPTTNILALCVRQFYSGLVYASYMQTDLRGELMKLVEKRSVLCLNKDHWNVHRFLDHDGKDWYRAVYKDSNLPLQSRGNKGLASWIKYDRPYTAKHAKECCPAQFRDIKILETEVYEDNGRKRKSVLFESIEVALRMEAGKEFLNL